MSKLSILLNKCLKKMDYFAITFQFRINNNKKYGSATGGIIFSVFLILSVTYFLKRLLDYVSWTDSKLQFIEKSPERTPILNLKDLEFQYAVSINFDNETSIYGTRLKDLFEIEHRYLLLNNTVNKTSNLKIITKPRDCKYEDFLDKIESSNIIHKNKYTYKCFDLDKTYNLEGLYTDKIFSYVEIFVKINKIYFKNYTNLEQIFKENQFKYTIYFLDNTIDVGKISDLTSIKVEAIYTYLDFDYYERNNIFLKEIQLCTDENLIFKRLNCKNFQKFSRYENKMAPFPNRNCLAEEIKYNINKFILRVESSKSQINVSFIKLSEFLSNVSVILVNALVILNIIFIPFNEIKARQEINKKIMDVKDVIKTENKSLLEYFAENYKNNKAFNSVFKYTNNKEKLKNSNINKFPLNDINISNNNVKNQNNYNDIKFHLQNSVEIKLKSELNDISNFKNSNFLNEQNVEMINNNIIDSPSVLKEVEINSEKTRVFPLNHNNNINNTNIRDFILNDIPQNQICEEDANQTNLNKNDINIENAQNNKNPNANNQEIEKKDTQYLKIENELILRNKLGKKFKTENSKKNNNPFKIRIKDLIKYIFRCRDIKSKLELNALAEKKFNQNIDIINYMTKIQEIDILKYLILDGDTLDIMNFLSKPKLLNNNNTGKYNPIYEKFFDYNIYEHVKNGDITDIQSSFDKIMSNENPNKVSLKIMEIFAQQIQNLIE